MVLMERAANRKVREAVLGKKKKGGFAYLFVLTCSVVSEIAIGIIAIVYKRLILGNGKHGIVSACGGV